MELLTLRAFKLIHLVLVSRKGSPSTTKFVCSLSGKVAFLLAELLPLRLEKARVLMNTKLCFSDSFKKRHGSFQKMSL